MPGHTRRPNPNGIVNSPSTLPLQLLPAGLCGLRNREGLNVSGSSNRVLDKCTVNCHLFGARPENGLENHIPNVTIDSGTCRNIIPSVNVALARCMGYRHRNSGAPPFRCNRYCQYKFGEDSAANRRALSLP